MVSAGRIPTATLLCRAGHASEDMPPPPCPSCEYHRRGSPPPVGPLRGLPSVTDRRPAPRHVSSPPDPHGRPYLPTGLSGYLITWRCSRQRVPHPALFSGRRARFWGLRVRVTIAMNYPRCTQVVRGLPTHRCRRYRGMTASGGWRHMSSCPYDQPVANNAAAQQKPVQLVGRLIPTCAPRRRSGDCSRADFACWAAPARVGLWLHSRRSLRTGDEAEGGSTLPRAVYRTRPGLPEREVLPLFALSPPHPLSVDRLDLA